MTRLTCGYTAATVRNMRTTLTETQRRVLVAIRDGSFHIERPSDAAVAQRLRREGFWWWAHGSEARREVSPAGLVALELGKAVLAKCGR